MNTWLVGAFQQHRSTRQRCPILRSKLRMVKGWPKGWLHAGAAIRPCGDEELALIDMARGPSLFPCWRSITDPAFVKATVIQYFPSVICSRDDKVGASGSLCRYGAFSWVLWVRLTQSNFGSRRCDLVRYHAPRFLSCRAMLRVVLSAPFDAPAPRTLS